LPTSWDPYVSERDNATVDDAVIIVEERLAEAQFYRVCEKSGPGSVLRRFILDLWSKQPKQVIEGDERYPKDMLVGRINVWQQIGSKLSGLVGNRSPRACSGGILCLWMS
jgi:hypothetical protein